MIDKNLFKNIVATLVCLAVVSALFAMPASAETDTPGTAVQFATLRTASATESSSTSLSPAVTETGKISLSVDGLGTEGVGTIQVEKPEGATVRSAYMFAASLWGNYPIADDQITLDGQDVVWDYYVYKNAYNCWADVTPLVKSKVDAAPAGRIDFEITESNSYYVDGTILVVIFDDPAQTSDNTIVLMFGSQSTGGDTFNLLLADPIDTSDPDMSINMGLGISYSFQSPDNQYSIVDVNNQRLTTAAGGSDDGAVATNGQLITVGGLGDLNTNPADPYAEAYDDPRQDDELYNILPFVEDGDTTVTVFTQNPSDDDNIFFAYFDLKSTVAVVGEGIVLSPSSETANVGDSHTVTATVQDDNGNPVASKNVAITITSGPHAGYGIAGLTDTDGHITFTYSGTGAGTDVIVASSVNDQQELAVSSIDNQQETLTSNEVTCTWTTATDDGDDDSNEIPEFPTIALPIAAIIGLAFIFNSRKEE